MSVTPLLGAPVLTLGQATPETTVNLIARYLEAFASRIVIEDRDLTAAPTLVDGKAYLVAGAPAGGDPWNGQGGKIALAINTSWVFITAREGIAIEVTDEAASFVRRSGAWVAVQTGNPLESLILAASDETTALTTGLAKVTFRMPYAFVLTDVRASLTTPQTGNGAGGIFTVDVNENGATVLSTKVTIDNGEETSQTGATAEVISDTTLADDAKITVDIDQIGDGTAKGLKVTLIGRRA